MEPGTQENSVLSVESQSQPALCSINATNADGSQKTLPNRLSSVQNAEIPLITETLRDRRKSAVFPIFFWRHMVGFSKNTVKIAGVVIPYSYADVGDRKPGALQQKHGLI